MVLVIAVAPLTASGVLAADGTQHYATSTRYFAVPFAGFFKGTYEVHIGGSSYSGSGFFTPTGWAKVQATQTLGTFPSQPLLMTIITTRGDRIDFKVEPGSDTYQITGGTGLFAHVVGGTGHFYLQTSGGQQGAFSGHLYGSMVFTF